MSPIDPSMMPMLDTFVFETTTLLEQLDDILLEAEKSGGLDEESVNEIFRVMHTIKGSAAMMGADNISTLAHKVEDLFFLIREDLSRMEPRSGEIFDLVFKASDFLKTEIENVDKEDYDPADAYELVDLLNYEIDAINGTAYMEAVSGEGSDGASDGTGIENAGGENTDGKSSDLSHVAEGTSGERDDSEKAYAVRVFFEDDIQMENIRAFMLLTQLRDYCDIIGSEPENPETDSKNSALIIKNGFIVHFRTSNIRSTLSVIENSLHIKSYELLDTDRAEEGRAREADGSKPAAEVQRGMAGKSERPKEQQPKNVQPVKTGKQSFISVNQAKLDQLMDLMGEIVITEAMVANNPDLKGLNLDNFNKSTRELRKLTDELQDIVMSIRMVPLSGVFQKMNRIVRDMSKKLGKEIEFVTEGGDTEVDKSINDIIGDPLMHMIRNAVDHAIETPEERAAAGKPRQGKVILGARNIGGEIVITVEDDGRGLDPAKILYKAASKGLLTKPESEYSVKEIYQLIMIPGFSTNDEVTEYSGRGVGMDVVRSNIEQLGGSVMVESEQGVGTRFTIKIPLTLAIVDGMELSVGATIFTVPITSIRQSFKINEETKVIHDTNGAEMIMLRGECYPIIRLHRFFNIANAVEDLREGIAVLIQSGSKSAVIFADELLGEQQVVVKPFPFYLNRFQIKSYGLAGCTILGDGSISLILDSANLINRF